MSNGTHTRGAHWLVDTAGALALAMPGCQADPFAPAVKEAARPHADAIRADAPNLLPEQPVASTTATRGQMQDVVPAGGANVQVAARIRAKVNDTPILEDEVRETVAQYAGEILTVPEAQRGEVVQKIADRELQRLIERELVLEEAFAKLKQAKLEKELQKLREEASREGDKRVRDIKQSLKVATDEELKAILRNQGLTVEGLRRQVERNFMMMAYV